jgi:hypothetical protein
VRALLALVMLAACGKGGGDPTAAIAAAAAPREALLATYQSNKLVPTPFAPYTGPQGGDCQTGAVSEVAVMICAFPTPAAAKLAEDAGLKWVGDTTGTAQAHGVLMIAAADRKKADPNGRTINQLMKLAPK